MNLTIINNSETLLWAKSVMEYWKKEIKTFFKKVAFLLKHKLNFASFIEACDKGNP